MRTFEEYIEEKIAEQGSSLFDYLSKSKPKESKKSGKKNKK